MEEIVIKKYEKKQREVEHKLYELEQLKRPISKREFEKEAREQLPNMSHSNLKEETNKLYMKAATMSREVTREDLIDLKTQMIYDHEDVFKYINTEKEHLLIEHIRTEETVQPSLHSITPFPEERYDPQDVYDLKNDLSHPIRPTFVRGRNWFDLPGSEVKRTEGEMFDSTMNQTPKFNRVPVDKREDASYLDKSKFRIGTRNERMQDAYQKKKGFDSSDIPFVKKRRQKPFRNEEEKD